MATGKSEVKSKISLEVRQTKKSKKVKIILKGSSSQCSDTTTSTGVMTKCNNIVVKKEKDDSSESNSRSAAKQIDDKALPNKFTGNETCEKVHEGEGTVQASQTDMNRHVSDQGDCVEPTSTSEQSKSVLHITQEERDLLKRQAAKLKRKNKRMSRELRKYVDMCMELQDDNKLIMDKLKQVCHPSVIQMLEAKNPYNNPQTDPEME